MRLEWPFRMFKGAALAVTFVSLAGCASLSRTDFPTDAEAQAALELENVTITRLTPQNTGAYQAGRRTWHTGTDLPTSTANWQYRVGAGDVLSVTVWDHPELTLPAGQARSAQESGNWVNADGTIFYPYVGRLKVAGLSINEVQRRLTTALAEYIPDPQIEVKVVGFNSQKVSMTGALAKSGPLPITNIPLTLIEAVNAVGGLTALADSRHVSIRRGGKAYRVDLRAFLANGRAASNPVLQGGDIINVPTLENNVAYILGQVQKPGPVDLGLEGLDLTGALAARGGLLEKLADARGIFVFRSKGAGFEVFQLDATTPLAFVLATKFSLRPQDVVYVTTDPAAQWNAVIASLLPSITAVRGAQVIGGAL